MQRLNSNCPFVYNTLKSLYKFTIDRSGGLIKFKKYLRHISSVHIVFGRKDQKLLMT